MTEFAGDAQRRRIIIFARAPERGCVKTRLAAATGDDAALEIYRWLGSHTLAVARTVPGCDVEVRYTPVNGADSVAAWLGSDVTMRPQCDGNLGTRMRCAIADALDEGADSVVVVGTDCPTLDVADIDDAFEALRRCDVAIGPANDGGYYLIAVRADHAPLFHDIPWNSPETLRHTLAAADQLGLRVRLLETRDDIDTVDDWRRFAACG